MKFICITLLSALLFSSCCKENHCHTGRGVAVYVTGYSQQEMNTAILFRYKEHTGFGMRFDSISYPEVFTDSSGLCYLQDPGFDFMITLAGDTGRVSDIDYERTSFKSCSGAIPKMGECQLLDHFLVSGDHITKQEGKIFFQK